MRSNPPHQNPTRHSTAKSIDNDIKNNRDTPGRLPYDNNHPSNKKRKIDDKDYIISTETQDMRTNVKSFPSYTTCDDNPEFDHCDRYHTNDIHTTVNNPISSMIKPISYLQKIHTIHLSNADDIYNNADNETFRLYTADMGAYVKFVKNFMTHLQHHINTNKHLPCRYPVTSFNFAERLVGELIVDHKYVCIVVTNPFVESAIINHRSKRVENMIIVHPITWGYEPPKNKLYLGKVHAYKSTYVMSSDDTGLSSDNTIIEKIFPTRKSLQL